MSRWRIALLGLLIYAMAYAPASHGAPRTFVAVVSGLGGESYYSERFARWGTTMKAAAEQRLERWTHPEVDRLHLDVTRLGLKAQAPDAPVRAVAGDLLELAAAGLRRLDARNRRGEDESLFLEPLFELLERGACPARSLLERWEAGSGDRRALIVDDDKRLVGILTKMDLVDHLTGSPKETR